MSNEIKFFTDLASASQIAEITGTDETTILTADENNDRIVSDIFVSSDDSSAQDLTLKIYDGTTKVLLGIAEIPIQAGTVKGTAIASLKTLFPEIFSIEDGSENKTLEIPKDWSLIAQMGGVTSGKKIHIVVKGASE